MYGVGEALEQPTSVAVGADGSTSATLTLDAALYEGPQYQIHTRMFNGDIPGPTLRVRQGGMLSVAFSNALEGDPEGTVATVMNSFGSPNITNMHTHGLHVSSESPGDSIHTHVDPGGSFDYTFVLPSDHAPGTHWYHPHVHGSTALQAGGGAGGLIIVEDEAGDLPEVYATMEEILVMLHHLNLASNNFGLVDVAARSNDDMTEAGYSNSGRGGTTGTSYVVANGQFQPVVSLEPNTWVRLRMAYAALESRLELSVSSGCEMQLLAKDGVYVRDAPRPISTAYLPSGGRADVALRCVNAGTYAMSSTAGTQQGPGGGAVEQTTIMTLSVSGTDGGADATLPSLDYAYPCYLADLRDVSDGALITGKEISFDRGLAINSAKFNHDVPTFSVAVGAIEEWTIKGSEVHPFHLHVVPYQLQSNNNVDPAYFQAGDWHDTSFVDDGDTVRVHMDSFTGEMIIHCHFLVHEDQGMMSWVRVTGTEGTQSYLCTGSDAPSGEVKAQTVESSDDASNSCGGGYTYLLVLLSAVLLS